MFKKLGVIILSAIMFLTIIPTPIFAANVKDTSFSFNIQSNANRYTRSRAKQNSSSTYVHVKQVPAVYIRTNVQGFRPTSGTGSNYWANETIGGQISLRKGQWLIKQLVYENGGRSARLQFKKHSTNGTVSGVWSPDSVGSYPYAN
ncbi:hypothetical protein [Amphibacillus cookii]|uniref:hypothetical protein n=1 Tax=Amphibacillus cookii TaxID=767787 RepID=UPI001957D994|nr:hypothetical protein [Amphibacillus cookii]MBM7542278.1 hypothetical protein [Amphibacillus cookii]